MSQWWVSRSSNAVVIVDSRVAQDAPELERVVSVVTVCAKRHALFGLTLPVVSTRSGRGPRFVVVLLSDGRTRSLLRSITDLEMEHSPAGQDPPEQSLRVSVRTLLPLARLLAARSPSQEGTGDDGADGSGPAVQLGAAARAPRHHEATARAWRSLPQADQVQLSLTLAEMVRRMAADAAQEPDDAGDHRAR